MTLQPLVENAVKHGLKQLRNDSQLQIRIQKEKDAVKLSIIDNGKGIEKRRLEELGKEKVHSETGTGIGLYNINRRLEMMYGEESTLMIESEKEKGTMVSFYLPIKK
jgi:two-component system sensor histidine kinase LytS